MENISRELKEYYLTMPLEEKIQRSKELILEWYLQYEGKVYVSFSGGKDSTVVLHLARSLNTCKDIKGVFSDTGLEYPEVREFVKRQDNITWIRPKLTFKQVIDKYGYPIISKEQAQYIYEYRTTKSEKLKQKRLLGGKGGMSKVSNQYRPLLNADFKISHKCCWQMKKQPFKTYERMSGEKPLTGMTAQESLLRKEQYFMNNCNAFKDKHPKSNPIMFWNEQDILRYLYENNVEIAKIYGEIKQDRYGKFYTTGVNRTGCMFCMFGLHLEQRPNKFDMMKNTHPKQYDYIMNKLNGEHIMNEYLKCCPKQNQLDLFY